MSDITKLERFLTNLDRLNYDAGRAIARLSEIDDLDKKVSDAQVELDRVSRELTEEQKRLSELQIEIRQANSTRASLIAENFKNSTELAAIRAQVEAASHRIEFAETVLLLFSNIEKIPVSSLMEFTVRVQMIVHARLNPAAIYPIDYEETRKQAIDLLELALGKSLVPREIFDEMMKRLGEQRDDLMLDRLGKMEKERYELDQMKAAIEQVSREKVMQTTAYQKLRGWLTREYTCPRCRVIIVHSMTDPQQLMTSCPFCGASLPSNNTNSSLQHTQG